MRVAAASGAAKHQVPGAAATEVPGAEPSIPHWLWEQAQVQQIPTRLLELQEVSNSVRCCLHSPERFVLWAAPTVAVGMPWVLQWPSVQQTQRFACQTAAQSPHELKPKCSSQVVNPCYAPLQAEMPLPSSGLPAAEAAPPSRSSSCCVEEPGREPAAEQPADAPSTDAERAVQVAQPRAAPPSRRLSVAAPVAAPAATALRAAASMTSWHAASPLEALTAQQTSARGRPQSGSIASGAAHQQPHSAPSRNTSSAQELVVRPPAIFKSQSAALRQVADLFEEDMHFALSQAPRAAPLRAGKKAALSAAKPQLLGARKPALASPRSSSGSSEHIPAIRGEAATSSGLAPGDVLADLCLQDSAALLLILMPAAAGRVHGLTSQGSGCGAGWAARAWTACRPANACS